MFACCGTGEFHSLDVDEFAECVRAAAEVAAGRVPVVAGVGYGAALAASFAAAAKEAGADGLLVMPPYLVAGGAAGLRDHYTAVAEATDLDLIIYQRDNVTFTPDVVADLAEVPNIVGFKDGKGDLDLMQRIVSAVRDRHGEGKLHLLQRPADRRDVAAGLRRRRRPGLLLGGVLLRPRHRAGLLPRVPLGPDEPGQRRCWTASTGRWWNCAPRLPATPSPW